MNDQPNYISEDNDNLKYHNTISMLISKEMPQWAQAV